LQNPQISLENGRSLLAAGTRQKNGNHGFAAGFEKTIGKSGKLVLILLKNPSGQKATVKKTISDVSLGHSNRVQTKSARKNSRHFSYILTHLQKEGVLQQNPDCRILSAHWPGGAAGRFEGGWALWLRAEEGGMAGCGEAGGHYSSKALKPA
jgi:hypothetical protein